MPQARYTLIPVNDLGVNIPYVIDSQTGRVWRETFDSQHNAFVFMSLNYISLDGALSKVPNETATDVVFKSQAKTALQRPLTPEEAEEAKAKGLDPSKYYALDDDSSTTNIDTRLIRRPTQRPPTPQEAEYLKSQGIDPKGFLVDDDGKLGEQNNEPTNTVHRRDPSGQLPSAITNPSPPRPNIP